MSEDGLKILRERYPWPAERPNVKPDKRGWCHVLNLRMFRQLVTPKTRVVVEVGSWLGLSSRYLVDTAPEAAVICIDHWNPALLKMPAYETFLRNSWPYREQIIPMRKLALLAMLEVYSLGIQADLVYLDGTHDARSVWAEVAYAMEAWPKARICGDDWTWETVRQGVEAAISGKPLKIESHSTCWHLESSDTLAPSREGKVLDCP